MSNDHDSYDVEALATMLTPELDAASLDTPPVPSETLGKMQERLILAGYGTKEVLAYISKHRPHAQTTSACVAWYRAKLRRENRLPAYRR